MALQPSDVTILVDTREQRPFRFSQLFKTERATLKTADYSIRSDDASLITRLAVERKSLLDLVGCCGHGRERFEASLRRMLDYEMKLVVVESPWREIVTGEWRSQLYPAHVMGSCRGWMLWGIPFIFCEGREQAAKETESFLWLAARRHLARSGRTTRVASQDAGGATLSCREA